MSETLQPIAALDVLLQAKGELEAGLRFMRVGEKVDAIDREHLEKSLVLILTLYNAQKK